MTFGGVTGADVKLNVQTLYSKQIRLIGSTGTRKEFTELIDINFAALAACGEDISAADDVLLLLLLS